MAILLCTITTLLERMSLAELAPADFAVECQVAKCRSEGNPKTDFANGTLIGRLAIELGTIEICIRWEAVGQTLVENGWIIREAPHLKGAFIKTESPIHEEGCAMKADCDELEALAYDFWSYRDICDLVRPALPCRSAERQNRASSV